MNSKKKSESYASLESRKQTQSNQQQTQQPQQQQQVTSNVRSASKEKRTPTSGLGTPNESKPPQGKIDGKKEKTPIPKPVNNKPPSKVTPVLFTNGNSTTGVNEKGK